MPSDPTQMTLPPTSLERDLLLQAALAQIKRMQDFICERGSWSDYCDWLEERARAKPT